MNYSMLSASARRKTCASSKICIDKNEDEQSRRIETRELNYFVEQRGRRMVMNEDIAFFHAFSLWPCQALHTGP